MFDNEKWTEFMEMTTKTAELKKENEILRNQLLVIQENAILYKKSRIQIKNE